MTLATKGLKASTATVAELRRMTDGLIAMAIATTHRRNEDGQDEDRGAVAPVAACALLSYEEAGGSLMKCKQVMARKIWTVSASDDVFYAAR